AALHRHATESPVQVLQHIHAALRPTRGAAVGVAEVDTAHRTVRFAGLGNIAGTIIDNGATRSIVSHHGTAGHDARRFDEFSYPWSAGPQLGLHSDRPVTHRTPRAEP